MIRIFIIEDHPVTVAGLRTYCRPERDQINVTQHTETIEGAVKIDADLFDIIFLDLWLTKDDPILNIEKIKNRFPGKPIIIYSGEQELYWQRKAYNSGVKGFLSKNASRTLIHETIKRVMTGEVVYSSLMIDYKAKRIITGYRDPKYGLTDDQHKIIGFFLNGVAPKEIAKEIHKDLSTVNRSLQKIREKFNVISNFDLMRILLNLDDFNKNNQTN